MKKSGRTGSEPGLGVLDQQGERSQGTSRDDLLRPDGLPCILDAQPMDTRPEPGPGQRCGEKSRLLGIRFHQIDYIVRSLRKQNGQDHSRQAAAAAEIDPTFGVRCQANKLGAVNHMATPECFQRRLGCKIYPCGPGPEQILIVQQAVECFT